MPTLKPAARWLVAVALGAIVATVGDHLHVVYGVLYYPHPAWFQQAAWVLPLFAGASLAMYTGSEATRRWLGGARVATDLGEAVIATVAFFVAYWFTAAAAELPNVVLGVLVLTWVVRARGLPRWVVVFSLASAVCGVLAECSLSWLGGFAYVSPDFLRVPRWLPGLYLHAALAAPRVRGLLDEPS